MADLKGRPDMKYYYGDIVCVCEPILGSFEIRDPDCRAGNEAHAIIRQREKGDG